MATIKICDDDAEFADNVARMLRDAGYTVSIADHTDGLIDSLIREKPDLVILDVMFPDNPVAGFDAARSIRLRRETKEIPVILLTGVNQEFPMDFSAKDIDDEWMPVQDFIEKPVTRDDLLMKVARLVRAQP